MSFKLKFFKIIKTRQLKTKSDRALLVYMGDLLEKVERGLDSIEQEMSNADCCCEPDGPVDDARALFLNWLEALIEYERDQAHPESVPIETLIERAIAATGWDLTGLADIEPNKTPGITGQDLWGRVQTVETDPVGQGERAKETFHAAK